MEKYKEKEFQIQKQIKKIEDNMKNEEIIEQLKDLQWDRHSFITGNGDDEIYINDYVALDKAIEIVEHELEREKDYIIGLICMTIILIASIVTLIFSSIENNKLLNQVDVAIGKYNEVNYKYKLLNEEYENLREKYEYVIDSIKTNDRYQLPEGLEE